MESLFKKKKLQRAEATTVDETSKANISQSFGYPSGKQSHNNGKWTRIALKDGKISY